MTKQWLKAMASIREECGNVITADTDEEFKAAVRQLIQTLEYELDKSYFAESKS